MSNACTPNTTYYWKIISHDNHGATTQGPIWAFTTGSNTTNYKIYLPLVIR